MIRPMLEPDFYLDTVFLLFFYRHMKYVLLNVTLHILSCVLVALHTSTPLHYSTVTQYVLLLLK